MTVKQIIRNYLEARSYAGLCNPGSGCGCLLSDFMPCDGGCEDCETAVRVDNCGDAECENCIDLGYHLEVAS